MSNSFFLTRQTANLLEDFVRELGAEPSLFLLYGDEGIGKTRALEELVNTRLGDATVHWIDLKAGGSGDGALVDSSGMIEKVFAEARAGDIIIADHFETALKKTRHQLFLSWSTDGIDNKVSMIIVSSTDFFNELRQLAQQYQVRVQSVQQMPMNPDEVTAFLSFYLFPDRAVGKMSMPPLLRNQVALAQGNIGKIIEIAERAGDQITMAPMNDTEQMREGSRFLLGVLIVVALVIAGGWYFIGSYDPAGQMQQVESEATGQVSRADPAVDAADPGQGAAAEPVGMQESPDPIALDEMQPEAEVEPLAETDAPVDVEGGGEAEGEIAVDESTETAPEDTLAATEPALDVDPVEGEAATPVASEAQAPEPTTEEMEPQQQQAAAETATDSTVAVAEVEPQPATEEPAQMTRLQRDLEASLDWINNRDRRIGTLQIMLLSLDRFDEQAYYEYVDEVARLGVANEDIRIFRTFTGGQQVYSVVYGEFESWKAAGNAADDIPEVLRKNSPIPRSVGGLLDEIRRLEQQN